MTDSRADTGPRIDRDYLIQTCQALVRINSINPILVPGNPGEAAIAEYVALELGRLGLAAERHEPEPGRVSVLGRRPGAGGGRSLMLNAHMDTVGVEGMSQPWSGEVREGRVYGRGAYDMKGSLACCLAVVKSLQDAGTPLRGDVFVAAVADEEYGSLGTSDLIRHIRPDAAIVTEPTGLGICLAHKGYLWIEVLTNGRAAHGSRFQEGIDANMRMGRFLSRLEELERALRARAPHQLVGPPSLHAALLDGGTGLSTYAAECRLQIERRSIPGETEGEVMREIQEILDTLQSEDRDFIASARAFFVRQPFEVSHDAPVVRTLADAYREVTGAAPRFVGDTAWMDAALLAEAGVESVVFGPTGAGAHAQVEWVDIDSMVRCAEVLAAAVKAYCA